MGQAQGLVGQAQGAAQGLMGQAQGLLGGVGAGGGGLPDIDEIYESVVERLKRDVLAERERMGDLHGDLLG
jgi:hypothetical protein